LRKFAFQELAYAIVVATCYGYILGFLYSSLDDVFIVLLAAIAICAHIAGILLIVRLEERPKKQKKSDV